MLWCRYFCANSFWCKQWKGLGQGASLSGPRLVAALLFSGAIALRDARKKGRREPAPRHPKRSAERVGDRPVDEAGARVVVRRVEPRLEGNALVGGRRVRVEHV